MKNWNYFSLYLQKQEQKKRRRKGIKLEKKNI